MMNWGVVGSELIAEDFIDTLLYMDRNCKLAMCNTYLKTKYTQLPCFTSYEELIEGKQVDVIYISTFVHEHQDWIKPNQTEPHCIADASLVIENKIKLFHADGKDHLYT